MSSNADLVYFVIADFTALQSVCFNGKMKMEKKLPQSSLSSIRKNIL